MRRYNALALATFLAIPVVMTLGVGVGAAINPEVGVLGLHYIWSFWLLTLLRRVFFQGSLVAVIGLWFLTCFLVVKAKNRHPALTALGVLGPFGFFALAVLGDRGADTASSRATVPHRVNNVESGSAYRRFVARLAMPVRVVYEAVFLVAAWFAADQAIELKRPLVVHWQAYVTGMSIDEVIRQQEAESGMWAFGEGMEMLFVFVLIYLLRPLLFNVAASYIRPRPIG